MAVYLENDDGTIEVLVEDYSAGEYARLQSAGAVSLPTLSTDVLALKSDVTKIQNTVDGIIADLNDVMILPSQSQAGV